MKPDYEKAAELLIEKCDKQTERITKLKIENAKLNIILYHRENGLSHADFNAEIEISKQSERIKELEAKIVATKSFCEKWKGDPYPIKSRHFKTLEQAINS